MDEQKLDEQKPEAIASAPAIDAPAAPVITPELKPVEAVEAAVPQGWLAVAREKTTGLRENRMALLAASVVFAAGFGAIAGALASSAYTHAPAAAPAVKTLAASELKPLTDVVAQLKAEIVALKTANDAAARSANAQFGKLAERMERIDKAQAEPTAKLTKMSDSLDRLEQKVASGTVAKDITGSVTPRQVAAVAPIAEPPKPQVLEGWRLRSVYDGAALLQGRGGLIEVEPGDTLPGGGRVERISRQDGRWVVTTSKGVIVSMK